MSSRAGLPLWIPDDVAGTCCATVWHSKGYAEGNRLMAERTADRFWAWSDEGRLPIVIDATSCTLGAGRELLPYLDVTRRSRHESLTILDSLSWAAARLLPQLEVIQKVPSASVHATCSMQHLGVSGYLVTLARAVADLVHVPSAMTYCAYAGDRGMLHPELTASATAREAVEVAAAGCSAHLSANRTCEVGLEEATSSVYESVVLALEAATRP